MQTLKDANENSKPIGYKTWNKQKRKISTAKNHNPLKTEREIKTEYNVKRQPKCQATRHKIKNENIYEAPSIEYRILVTQGQIKMFN